MRIALCGLLLCLQCRGWHFPVHRQITGAALGSLPAGMRRQWSGQEKDLAERYCLYPDLYQGASGGRREEMRIYCETPEGVRIHNVTWRRSEDLRALEYTLENLVRQIRAGNAEPAARHAGVLAHYLEDSTCPAHALLPQDGPLAVIKEIMPPPAGKEEIELHAVIEQSAPAFDLAGRAPRSAGDTVTEAARSLLERCYAVIRENRAGLLELIRAAYADDRAAMDRHRRRSAIAAAEILADAYSSAFALAGKSAPESGPTVRNITK